ncbi:MAG: sigma-70 family RNA polymerase sigma factor [Gammaproteobacteria bacterium]|nr:sigma-70 family RNA polymerase sigma factor [Gammaproteobacteria bacterium]
MQGEQQSEQHLRFQQPVAKHIVRNAQLGDMLAHSEIYKMFSLAVFTLARGICRNQQCAEDVLHNTFIQLINKISSFENRAPFGMWLRQIAVNESLMYLRKQKKHNSVLSTDEFTFYNDSQSDCEASSFASTSKDFAQQHSDQHELSRILSTLPEHVRIVLWLKEAEGYTHEEIAKLVGKTPSYSKTLVARAYKFLRNNTGQSELAQSAGEH